jgi:hypothetical protein
MMLMAAKDGFTTQPSLAGLAAVRRHDRCTQCDRHHETRTPCGTTLSLAPPCGRQQVYVTRPLLTARTGCTNEFRVPAPIDYTKSARRISIVAPNDGVRPRRDRTLADGASLSDASSSRTSRAGQLVGANGPAPCCLPPGTGSSIRGRHQATERSLWAPHRWLHEAASRARTRWPRSTRMRAYFHHSACPSAVLSPGNLGPGGSWASRPTASCLFWETEARQPLTGRPNICTIFHGVALQGASLQSVATLKHHSKRPGEPQLAWHRGAH